MSNDTGSDNSMEMVVWEEGQVMKALRYFITERMTTKQQIMEWECACRPSLGPSHDRAEAKGGRERA